MRRTLLAVGSLAAALVLQLVVLNGLHLPGGGVPDLVLLLVAVLAITGTPVRGMITGFAAGLALDIAPPGSAVLGEYALTLCLVGWAAGRMNRLVDRSAVRALAGLAVVVALAEGLAAAISIGLDPAQFSLAHARQVLPSAVGYDLLLLPFLMYLALMARTWAEAGPLDSDLDPAGVFACRSPGSAPSPAPPAAAQPRIATVACRPARRLGGHRPRRPRGGLPAPSRLRRTGCGRGAAWPGPRLVFRCRGQACRARRSTCGSTADRGAPGQELRRDRQPSRHRPRPSARSASRGPVSESTRREQPRVPAARRRARRIGVPGQAAALVRRRPPGRAGVAEVRRQARRRDRRPAARHAPAGGRASSTHRLARIGAARPGRCAVQFSPAPGCAGSACREPASWTGPAAARSA